MADAAPWQLRSCAAAPQRLDELDRTVQRGLHSAEDAAEEAQLLAAEARAWRLCAARVDAHLAPLELEPLRSGWAAAAAAPPPVPPPPAGQPARAATPDAAPATDPDAAPATDAQPAAPMRRLNLDQVGIRRIPSRRTGTQCATTPRTCSSVG